MKSKSFKRLLTLATFLIVPLLALDSGHVEELIKPMRKEQGQNHTNEVTGVTTNPKQYIGYGYDVTAGKALYESDALMLNSPILDIDNTEVQNSIKVFDGSKTEYQSSSSSSRREISKRYANDLGSGASIGGQIGPVNVNVGSKFNMTTSTSWSKVSNEEYSYYTIFAGNRPVVLQIDQSSIANYLNANFRKDLICVEDKLSANKLFKKYGTHLLTGYTLGGIFEMTNYYATDSDSYVKEQQIGFDTQVGLAMGSYASGELSFSFTNEFGYKDNNKHAVNQYKCSTYGGLTFPGLTIDQAFSWYETLTGAGYVYQLWTDSINAGKNLVIVSIPQSSRMIPLWDLLPFETKYNEQRRLLMESYKEMADNAYNNYEKNNQDRYKFGIGNDVNVESESRYLDRGFTYTRTKDGINNPGADFFSTYMSSDVQDSTIPYRVWDDGFIYMHYDVEQIPGGIYGWRTTGAVYNVIKRSDFGPGVFEINKAGNINSDKKVPFTLSYVLYDDESKTDYTVLFERKFTFDSNTDLSGGDGSQEHPFIIASKADFIKFSQDQSKWGDNVHLKLGTNIDLQKESIGIIGNPENSFKGIFDGNGYTISGLKQDASKGYICLFFKNDGVIKNLNVNYLNKTEYAFSKNQAVPCIFSGLVALNGTDGLIENCSVKNLNIALNYSSGSIFKSVEGIPASTLMVGGIAAYSNGKIEHCSLVDSNINIDLELSFKDLYLGGIVGLASSYQGDKLHSQINACDVVNFTAHPGGRIFGSISFGKLYMGVIAGRAMYADLNDVLVNNPKITYAPNIYEETHIGGIIGFSDKNVSLNNVIGFNINGIDMSSDIKEEHVACYIGSYQGTLTIKNSFLVTKNLNAKCVGNLTCLNVGGQFDLTARTTITLSELKNKIGNPDVWSFNKEPKIIHNQLDIDSLYLDIGNSKTRFVKGEPFSFEQIKILGYYSDGTDYINENPFIMNLNDIDENIIGSKKVIVSIDEKRTKTLSYDIEYVNPEIKRIEVVENKQDETVYYEGQKISDFNTNSVYVKVYKENNYKPEIIDRKSTSNPDGYTVSLNGEEFRKGNNVLTFEYGDFKFNYNIDAYEKRATEIKILNADKYNNEKYPIGTNNIDFSGLEVQVSYKIINFPGKEDQLDISAGMEVVKGSECEFIYGAIVEGDNNVIDTTYNVSLHAAEKIRVIGVDDSYVRLVNSFISCVNQLKQLDENTPLNERFRLINECQDILKEIKPDYTDPAFEQAKLDLQEAVENYNELIGYINDNFAENVEANESLNQIILLGGGMTTLLAIVVAVLKVIK